AIMHCSSRVAGPSGDGSPKGVNPCSPGTAEAGSTVKVFDGTTQIGTATANASGVWTFATATLSNGAHNFTAKAMDAAGNTGAASSAMTVTVAATVVNPPTITSFSPDSNVTGDGITNATVLTLSGTAVANSTVH